MLEVLPIMTSCSHVFKGCVGPRHKLVIEISEKIVDHVSSVNIVYCKHSAFPEVQPHINIRCGQCSGRGNFFRVKYSNGLDHPWWLRGSERNPENEWLAELEPTFKKHFSLGKPQHYQKDFF